jgi:endo-1,4-beta-xylanase
VKKAIDAGGWIALIPVLLMGCGGGLLADAADPADESVYSESGQESLAALFNRCGISDFGTAIERPLIESPLEDQGYVATLLREFNTVKIGDALMWLHPDRGRYDFSRLDKRLEFAETHGLKIYSHLLGHTIHSLPRWFVEPIVQKDLGDAYAELQGQEKQDSIRRAVMQHSWTAAERQTLIGILEDYISTMVGRYRGRISAWVVVNEPIHPRRPEAPLRNTLWRAAIGPEYIEMALRAARAADPEAKLILNDFGIEGLGAKSDSFYDLVEGLKSSRVPLDAAGLQMHISLTGYPPAPEVRANIRRLGDLGLEVYITEFDVAIEEPATTAEIDTQASRYREILQACLSESSCKAFFTWGFTDKYSWIPAHRPGYGKALIFDESFRPKPAYEAIREALMQCQ